MNTTESMDKKKKKKKRKKVGKGEDNL